MLNWIPTFRPHSVDGRPPGLVPVTQGPRKSEHPKGGPIRSPESVLELVSWRASATTPDIRIHSKQVLGFASGKVLMLRDASKEPRPPPVMRVAALTLVAWTLSGGQLCSTTGLDSKKGFGWLDHKTGFGSQLSPLGMCWIETQQPPCGCATGVMPCGPHCKVALPFVGVSISAPAFLVVGLGVRQDNWCLRGLFLAVQFTLAARICSLLEQRVSL